VERHPATDPRKEEVAFDTGKLMMEILKKGLLPRQIITRKSLHNAIAGVMATGGSTNAVLHLLAIAKEAGVKLAIDEFDKISRKTPLLADMRPGATTRRPRCTTPAAWAWSPSGCWRPSSSTAARRR
jgi:dihydroxy-acid dehydratase